KCVFIFFGVVATYGTAFIQIGRFDVISLVGGCAAGLFASAVLMVNNIRDIPGDARSGKRTLAVRLGESLSKRLFVATYGAAAAFIVAASTQSLGAILGLFGLLAALPAISTVRNAAEARDLVLALGMVARVQLVVGVLFAVGLIIR
ncbi:MAG: 1,4-dihydroxy-2-naphthoate polyprenyltransferase, partial [Actinobacteria bacterium]|nr:1,4-dihydroxy-2-naphthoate polyprenyltransferase [Actinomycetota bacterium]